MVVVSAIVVVVTSGVVVSAGAVVVSAGIVVVSATGVVVFACLVVVFNSVVDISASVVIDVIVAVSALVCSGGVDTCTDTEKIHTCTVAYRYIMSHKLISPVLQYEDN